MIPRSYVELGELRSICPACASQHEAAHFHAKVQDFMRLGLRVKAAQAQRHRQYVGQRARREMNLQEDQAS